MQSNHHWSPLVEYPQMDIFSKHHHQHHQQRPHYSGTNHFQWLIEHRRRRVARLVGTLPDLCLLAIFAHLPLQSIPAVLCTCSRWYSFRAEIYRARRSLHLAVNKFRFGVPRHYHQYQYQHHHGTSQPLNVLCYGELSDRQLRTMSSLLNSVTHLKISFEDTISLGTFNQLATLFEEWAEQLVSVSMSTKYWVGPGHERELYYRMVCALNSLRRLRQLRLCIRGVIEVRKLDLTRVLSRLEVFQFRMPCGDLPDLFVLLAKSLGDGNNDDNRLRVELLADERGHNNAVASTEKLERFVYNRVYNNGWTARGLARLFIGELQPMCFTKTRELYSFCTHFTQLTTIRLFQCELSLAQVTRPLSWLPHLERLNIRTHQYEVEEEDDKHRCVPLRKVTWLGVTVHHMDPLSEASMGKNRIVFPNLEAVTFTMPLLFDHNNTSFPWALKPLARSFVQSCSRLKHVYLAHDYCLRNDIHITVEDLMASEKSSYSKAARQQGNSGRNFFAFGLPSFDFKAVFNTNKVSENRMVSSVKH